MASLKKKIKKTERDKQNMLVGRNYIVPGREQLISSVKLSKSHKIHLYPNRIFLCKGKYGI